MHFLDSSQIESKLVNFTISSNHHPQKIRITKTWSIPNLSIPHTSYSAQELQKRYQHLQGIDIPSISSSHVTVLIGADTPQLPIHEEYKTGKENEPHAVRTKLGWILVGGKSSKLEKSVTNNVCLSDCNWTRTYNHLVHKQTLNHLAKLTSLAKWLSVRL